MPHARSRGELWTVARGVHATKPRRALIIQDDPFDGTASVMVLPLTSSLVDATALSGSERDSDVMIDKPTTVRRQDINMRVGSLTPSQFADVEQAMMVFLGLAR